MFSQIAAVAFMAAAVVKATPQGVTATITPDQSAPSGCATSFPSPFMIRTLNVSRTEDNDKVRRQQPTNQNPDSMGTLILNLQNGKLMNTLGDTGYIAANTQFQFDNPPQTGAIYTAGFSVCSNNTLAIGNDAIFYSCNSGDFNNLYTTSLGGQCSQVYISVLPQSGSVSSADTSMMSSMMTSAAPAPTSSAVSQVSDNQPQGQTSVPGVTQVSDNQPQAATSVAGVTQISDNQPQAATSAPAGTPAYTPYTGAAAMPTGMAQLGLAAAGLAAVALL